MALVAPASADNKTMTYGAQQNAAPGWYPRADGTMMYWDGRAWTQHTTPPAPTVPDLPRRGQGVYTDPYLLTSTPIRILFAILTFLSCGLFGLVWLAVELVARSLKKRGF